MTEAQAATTQFCARVIGPLLLIIGAVVGARSADLALILPAVLQDSPLAFITGLFTLIMGLVLVVAHHHWSSPTAIVISLIGVFTILRGITLMFAPGVFAGFVHIAISGAGVGVIAAGVVWLLIGAWLTFDGWLGNAA